MTPDISELADIVTTSQKLFLDISLFDSFSCILLSTYLFFRLYPVDKTRANEYGMVFEESKNEKNVKNESKKNK